MPAELDRMVAALMKKGHSKKSAFKIARSKLGTDKQIKARRKK